MSPHFDYDERFKGTTLGELKGGYCTAHNDMLMGQGEFPFQPTQSATVFIPRESTGETLR